MVVEIDGVTLHLAHPDELTVTWVGQEEVMRQLLAAWLVVDSQDVPMNPRLLGKPGVGKTTLAYAAAKRLGRACAWLRTRRERTMTRAATARRSQIQEVGRAKVRKGRRSLQTSLRGARLLSR